MFCMQCVIAPMCCALLFVLRSLYNYVMQYYKKKDQKIVTSTDADKSHEHPVPAGEVPHENMLSATDTTNAQIADGLTFTGDSNTQLTSTDVRNSRLRINKSTTKA